MQSEGYWSEEPPWTEAEWERFIRDHDAAVAARGVSPEADVRVFRELGLRGEARPGDLQREHFGDEEYAELRFIPAFRLAASLAAAVEAGWTAERGRAVVRIWIEPLWADLSAATGRVAAAIAAGHGIGYEEAHICGNIVKCREAYRHLERAIALIQRLREVAGHDVKLDELLGTAVFIRQALRERISALRHRVWWDDQRAVV
ncbi:MAG: hypothetical protein IT204_20425 [Fimbriimonadaceae bacterium]|nr:hypothetical protein [Fimbriimonadaceae bacterium]